MTTRREAALARLARFIVFAVPYIVFAVGVLLLTAAVKVLGPAFDWPYAQALALALFVVTVVWVGRRASWRPRAVVGAMLSLVFLGVASMVSSEAVSSMRPLVQAREDRVMADVRGFAADAGFTALVVSHRQSDFYTWPSELADPAGFTLAYGSPGGAWIAEYRATGPVSAEDLQSMVAAGQPIAPGLSQVIPEGVAHQNLTVHGGPAVGLEFVDASVLVTVIGDVVVRAWLQGEEGLTPLVAAVESLVPLQ
jgi:hypothetical protein